MNVKGNDMVNADEREDWHNAVEAAKWYVTYKTIPLYGIEVNYQMVFWLKDRLERLEAVAKAAVVFMEYVPHESYRPPANDWEKAAWQVEDTLHSALAAAGFGATEARVGEE